MLLVFQRRLRHPFFPALKLVPAAHATGRIAALYGAMDELSDAARRGTRANRAVFPLLPPSRPFLPDPDRETLWNLFQVPVYAVVLDRRHTLIGYECEAQHGIHIRDSYAPGLLFGRVITSPCDCGRPGARLISADAAAPRPIITQAS